MEFNFTDKSFIPRSGINTYTVKDWFGELSTTQCLLAESFDPNHDSCGPADFLSKLSDAGYAQDLHRHMRDEWGYRENHTLFAASYDFRLSPESRKEPQIQT
jgi:Lecithin:cholesterol acyltransferase